MSNELARLGDTRDAALFDKMPPHSLPAEQCLLASMLLSVELADETMILLPGAEVFYLADNQIIFNIITDFRRRGRPIDPVILREELIRRDQLDEIGGTAYIAQMLDTVPSAANGLQYATIVLEKFRRRELISAASKAQRDATGPNDIEEIATELARASESVRDRGGADPTLSLYQAGVESLRVMTLGKPRRIMTGLNEGDPTLFSTAAQKSFDFITGGLPVGGYTIIGGRPGSGKSQIAKQFGLNWADMGYRVGIVAIEENAAKIAENAMANRGDVPNWKIQRGMVSPEEIGAMRDAVERFKDLPIFIDDAQLTQSSVESAIRRLVKKHKCDIVIIDHLHLIQHEGDQRMTRNDQITKISGAIKNLIKRLAIVGVVVCQLNRKDQDGETAVPTLTNLREGGALEQDGDLIILLHRRDYYRLDRSQWDHKMEAYIAKNKAGGTGMAELYFDGDHQAILDWCDGIPPSQRKVDYVPAELPFD